MKIYKIYSPQYKEYVYSEKGTTLYTSLGAAKAARTYRENSWMRNIRGNNLVIHEFECVKTDNEY